MKSLVWLAAASSLVLCACGGGGGGGGPQTGVTTPTPPTPPAVCGGAPSSLTCAGTQLTLGWTDSASYSGAGAGLGVGGILRPAVVLDNKATSNPADDAYYGWASFPSSTSQPYDLIFTQWTSLNDGLGAVRRSQSVNPTNQRTHTLEIYDLSAVLGRGLDYIQLARVSGQFMGPDNPGALTYLALANWSAQPTLPTTGSANYKGGLRGSYFRNAPDAINVSGDMAMTVAFGANTFSGSTSNMKWATTNGDVIPATDNLAFAFNGRLDRTTYLAPTLIGTASGGAAGNGETLQGHVYGGFGGAAGGAPTEAGLNFGLSAGTLNYRFLGVGGMTQVAP